MKSPPMGHEPEVHLNLNVRGLKPSATMAINERSERLRREGREIFKLGLGQSPFPVPAPLVEALRAHAHEKAYLPVKGLPELREAVADYHRRAQGLGATAEDVLIGPGSKELMFLLQLVYYGDIMIPAPSWVSYAPQAVIVGRQVRWIQTDPGEGWRLTAARLEEACADDPEKPRIVVLNYPSNPTGRTYSVSELRDLAEVARAHRALVLSDEIYGELRFDGHHVSIARFYPEGTIVSGGLSKWCGAGGWRLGTFVFPQPLRWLLDAMAVVASETFTSTSAPIQYAAIRAFEPSHRLERYLWTSRRILAALGTECAGRLRTGGISVDAPEGAFYLFPDFGSLAERLRPRGIRNSDQLCERLLEDSGVAMLPGSDFGMPRGNLTARLAYVDFDGIRAHAAAEQAPPEAEVGADFLESRCGRVLEAVDRIVRWVRE